MVRLVDEAATGKAALERRATALFGFAIFNRAGRGVVAICIRKHHNASFTATASRQQRRKRLPRRLRSENREVQG
ncbi:MAG: hypothetical protein EPO28_01355 [Saprospiraceae bacterium]|nr:MAG: hypothetical protein EPO28_01355 [Saprospiraceae bacterium]